jgi:hypothetical protein
VSKVATALRKLRGRSLEELRVRGAQALAAAGERASSRATRRALTAPLLPAVLPRILAATRAGAATGDAAAVLAHFRTRAAPVLFAAFDDPAATVAAVRRYWPDAESAIVDRADRALRGRFDVLGLRDLFYGDPVDWHLDPVAGKRAPLVHWSRVPYLDPEQVGDHKVIWEVNRHQHFVTFGQAYWLTGDARYAAGFARQLAAWMDANPPKVGINWASSLEVAFRAIAWVWALHFFRHAPELTPELYGRTLAYLDVSARHLERYLSTYFSPNTHLTGEALGLLYAGTLFPELRGAERWRAVGWSVLTRQLDVQIRADGVYFEQASYYHRYTADFYLHAVDLRERNGYEVDPRVLGKLDQLLEHLASLSRPDGRIPLVGDDDGGRLMMLTTRHPADARATLALGALRYGRADLAAAGDGASDELAWVGGPSAVEGFARLERRRPEPASRAFPAGGYFVMRDGRGAEASYALIDCGPHGTMNCGHAHADVLALELGVRGRPVLVDAGTYTYPGPERNAFRTGEAHNTTTLDGLSSSAPGASAFTWESVAHGTLGAWASDELFDFFAGEHDGYERLAAPATVGRSVFFVKGRIWVVADRVRSAGAHTLRVHYHAAPGLVATSDGAGSVTLAAPEVDQPGLAIVVPALGGAAGTRVDVGEGWVSELYAAREPAATCTIIATTTAGDFEQLSFLLPRGAGTRGETVREHPAARGRIFALGGGGVDGALILRGGGAGAGTGEVDTDASWAWMSPASDPQEFVVIGGSRLLVAGEALVNYTEPVAWVAGRRVGGAWRLRSGASDPRARG